MIYLTATVLTCLIGAVLFLLTGPGVALLQLVVVTEHDFRCDATALTPLPAGATAKNANRLTELFDRCRDANRRQIGDGADFESVNELINGDLQLAGQRLFIYCAVDAWCVLDKDHPEDCVLELLPANFSSQQPPVRFSKLLSNFKTGKCPQVVLVMEFTGRMPGLASGAITDDIPQQVRREVKLANVPGLTVICSHEQGERSWEYVSDAAATTSVDEKSTNSQEPAFQGTAFGHFLHQAVMEGRAGTPSALHATLKKNVAEWVERQFGEPQTVWMISTDPTAAGKELLTLATLPKEKRQVAAQENTDAKSSKASAETARPADGEPKDNAPAKDPIDDDRPAARLKRLLAQRDQLRDLTETAVLYPADWLQLQTNLLAAERFAMNGNDHEFNSLHDDILKKTLKDLERKASEFSQSQKQRDIDDWIAADTVPKLTADEAKLLKQTLNDFRVDPNKASSLPRDEAIEHRNLRQALSVALTENLKNFSKSIAEQSLDTQASLIQEHRFLLQNLSSRWSDNVIPEAWATISEVLRDDEVKWQVTAIPPLVQLLNLRREALQLAAGRDSGGKLLRRNDWRRISKDVDELLRTLHSAERWLCVGPEGKLLAEDRLEKAKQTLLLLKEQVAISSRLTRIQDAQRFQIPYMIQYMALRLEEIPLTDKEFTAAKLMATKVIGGNVTVVDFPVGQLNPLNLNREHIEAMFALTRDFSRPQSEVTEVDEKHIAVLERFINSRLTNSAPADEARELLNTPLVQDRQKQYQVLMQPRVGSHRNAVASAERSGIWTSFWSLRLVDAVSRKSEAEDWQKWSDLVATVADPDQKSKAVIKRAAMAELLRRRWIDAIDELKHVQNSDVFAPENERLELLTKDLIRRVRTSSPEHRRLYSQIQVSLSVRPPKTETESITVLNPNAELSSDYSATTNVRVSHATQLYILNNDVTLKNSATQADRNWLKLPLNDNGESEVALEIGLQKAPQIPTDILIVAVNHEGSPVQQVITTLQPPSEHTWEISVAQVEEGNPEPRPITLEEMGSRTNRRLRLLPSTLDSAGC